MNDEKLKGLLIALITAQDNVTHANEAGPDYVHEAGRLILERNDIRAAIMSEFAALRQQRDELAKVSVDAWHSCPSGCFQLTSRKPQAAYKMARAALASIEGADDCPLEIG